MFVLGLGNQQPMTIASIEPNQPIDSRALKESGEASKSVAWTQHLWRELLSWTI